MENRKTKVIYKYNLVVTGEQVVNIPKGAVILSAQEQGGVLFIWAIITLYNELEERKIEIYGTGHEFPEDRLVTRKFINTVLSVDGFVWHVFESTA